MAFKDPDCADRGQERGSLRSLHQFLGEKHGPLAVRFNSNPPSMQTVSATIQFGDRAAEVKNRRLPLPL
jgi:hypothetical protein